jgi:hypothetical protein
MTGTAKLRCGFSTESGGTVKFSGLSGQIKFAGANSSIAGKLSPPAPRHDMVLSVPPYSEWFILLEQRIPGEEATKLIGLRDAGKPILFELIDLKINVAAERNEKIACQLPIWGGVSYSRDNGYGRIIYAVAGIGASANVGVK